MNTTGLTWSLVIATYKRGKILAACVEQALKQTKPPKQIIIIDSSPDWEKNRELIRSILERQKGSAELLYEVGTIASIVHQRNQGVRLSSSDISFLIDDDSLMYSDCAEEILKVYSSDIEEKVMGVAALHVEASPLNIKIESDKSEQKTHNSNKGQSDSRLRQLFKKALKTKSTEFLPYDLNPVTHQLPNELSENPDIGQIMYMPGYAMTFRTSVFEKIQFSEILRRYSAGEDQDLSYRVSQIGAMVVALKGKLHHMEISGGRLSPKKVMILACLNPAVLQVLYSKDIRKVSSKWKQIVRKRVLINFIKDFSDGRFLMERTRGVFFAYRLLKKIYSMEKQELEIWYPKFQNKIIDE